MTSCRWIWGFFGVVAVWLACSATAHAEDQLVLDLRAFAQEPRAQRNRVPAEQVPPAIAAYVLSILSEGVRSCDCLPRRLRWVWALPRPADKGHPSLVVSFDDRPRDHDTILVYERVAYLTYQDGKYRAQGVLTLNRPLATVKAALSVSMLPRRDVDQDGQLDIGVRFAETFHDASECGRVLFASSASAPTFEALACSELLAAD